MLSYKHRLLLNLTLFFLGFTALLVGFQYHRERLYKRELLESRLCCYADVAAQALTSHPDSTDTEALARLRRAMPEPARLTLMSRTGRVVFESERTDTAQLDNHSHRPEVEAALLKGVGSDIRLSHTTGAQYFYFAKNYGDCVVRVALPYDEEVKALMKADHIFLWFVCLLLPAAFFIILFISDRFGRSIAALRAFIDSAGRGLVDYKHLHFPKGELGDISRILTSQFQELEIRKQEAEHIRERLVRHFHYFDEGIAIFSPERERLYANPKFTAYVNLLLDRPSPDLRLMWESPAFAPLLDFLRVSGGERVLTEEAPVFRYTRQAGSTYLAIQALVYADGSFEVTLADVTRMEKTRILKQQMSNNITHELRTPVASIRGYLETLLTCSTLTPDRQAHFLRHAYAQTERLTELIRDVSLISKTEEAPALLPREDIELNKLVADTIEELRPHIAEARQTISSHVPAHCRVRGNYTLLHAIFRNLIENATRYAGPEAQVAVECYTEDKSTYYFRFYDTGRGCAPEHLTRLFERFYRAEEGRTRQDGGTGLGLSIVKNAVHFHGGTISVRLRQGGGLEFLFTLSKGHGEPLSQTY